MNLSPKAVGTALVMLVLAGGALVLALILGKKAEKAVEEVQ